jgi:hypothetical protein
MASELASAEATSIGIVGSAHGGGHSAGLGDGDLGLARGGGDLGGSCCTGENEDDDEGADDSFHFDYPEKLYLRLKISLDKPDETTIG